MDADSVLSDAVIEQVERIGQADIMVGIPSYRNAATIPHVVKAATAGLVQYFPDQKPVLVNSDGGSPDRTRELVLSTESPDYVEQIILVEPTHRLQRVSLTYRGIPGKGSAFRAIFDIARRLGVKACVVVDSDLRSIVPEWIELLAGPIVKGGFDFVAPLYCRHKFDGTITNMVAYPLTRALYGKRVRQPIGGDFGLSSDLIAAYLDSPLWDEYVARYGIDIWMTTLALNEGFAVCQANLGAKIHDAKDPGADLGPMFREVVGTLFRLAHVYQGNWMQVRGSRALPVYGLERIAVPPPIEVNVERLIEQFRMGTVNYLPLWQAILPADTIHDLGELAKLDEGRFYFPAELWIKCIYDFLYAYGTVQGFSKEQILNSLTPIYFGRVASFVVERIDSIDEVAEQDLERQAREFERLKPYLVSRFEALHRSSGGSNSPLRALGSDNADSSEERASASSTS